MELVRGAMEIELMDSFSEDNLNGFGRAGKEVRLEKILEPAKDALHNSIISGRAGP